MGAIKAHLPYLYEPAREIPQAVLQLARSYVMQCFKDDNQHLESQGIKLATIVAHETVVLYKHTRQSQYVPYYCIHPGPRDASARSKGSFYRGYCNSLSWLEYEWQLEGLLIQEWVQLVHSMELGTE